jgi:hypothetical protein
MLNNGAGIQIPNYPTPKAGFQECLNNLEMAFWAHKQRMLLRNVSSQN